jgi:hypothetical protein
MPGQLGEYVPLRVIAKGGMGIVFEVVSLATGARFAAKMTLRADRSTQARFRREAILLARCDRHPGVVKVHGFGETEDGSLYMILDLVQGESLDEMLKREGRLAPARAARLGAALARALGHIHARGIVHRDVKPSNVLLDAAGEPRLTDFGLACAPDVDRLTHVGSFVGTPQYCSPEQARGFGLGPATDVFSLGCVLFQMLTGECPFSASTMYGLFEQLSSREPFVDVRLLAPAVPAAVAEVVALALSKRPEDRPASGDELARLLERATAPRARRSLARVARRRAPVAVALVASAIAVAAGVAAGLALRARPARPVEAARPDLERVAPAATARAREATDATALLRRALASSDRHARERDLALASRLAPAPSPLGAEAAQAWLDLALGPALAELEAGPAGFFDPNGRHLEALARAFERAALARQLDPGARLDRFWPLFAMLLGWQSQARDAEPTARLCRRFAAAWPDEPALLYMAAFPRSAASGSLLERAAGRMPKSLVGGDALVARELALAIDRSLGASRPLEARAVLTVAAEIGR